MVGFLRRQQQFINYSGGSERVTETTYRVSHLPVRLSTVWIQSCPKGMAIREPARGSVCFSTGVVLVTCDDTRRPTG